MLAVDERRRSLIPTVRAPIPAPESPPSDAHRVGVHNVAGSHKGNFCSAATFRGHQAGKNRPDGERVMLGTILIIILVLLLVGARCQHGPIRLAGVTIQVADLASY